MDVPKNFALFLSLGGYTALPCCSGATASGFPQKLENQIAWLCHMTHFAFSMTMQVSTVLAWVVALKLCMNIMQWLKYLLHVCDGLHLSSQPSGPTMLMYMTFPDYSSNFLWLWENLSFSMTFQNSLFFHDFAGFSMTVGTLLLPLFASASADFAVQVSGCFRSSTSRLDATLFKATTVVIISIIVWETSRWRK